MKAEDCKKIKREMIEIHFNELIKYIVSKVIYIMIIGLISALLLATFKYINDTNEKKNNETLTKSELYNAEKLQNYQNKLAYMENMYASENQYKNNSILMNLDYKNIHMATIQYYVEAEDKDIESAMTAYSNYGKFSSLGADIYVMNNTISESCLMELISLSCSDYTSEGRASIITVRVYYNSEKMCKEYAQLAEKALENFCIQLNENGLRNSINKISEDYYLGQDIKVWNLQKECNTRITEIESSINTLNVNIQNLRNMGAKTIDEIEHENKVVVQLSEKYAIVGFVVGAFLMAIIYSIGYIFNDKIKYCYEIENLTDIRLIDTLNLRKNEVNKQYEKLNIMIQSYCNYIGINNFSLIFSEKDYYNELLDSLISKIVVENVSVGLLGDVVDDVASMKKMKSNDNVIILVNSLKTTYTYIDKVVEMCRLKGVNIMGYIFVNN